MKSNDIYNYNFDTNDSLARINALGKQFLSLQTNYSYDTKDVKNIYITDITSISNFYFFYFKLQRYI